MILTITPVPLVDLEKCLGHAEGYYEHLGIGGAFNTTQFLSMWRYMYRNASAQIFGLSKDGKDIGGMGVVVAQDQCSIERVGTMMWMFIDEDARGGIGALMLYRRAETWAKDNGAVRMRVNFHPKPSPFDHDKKWIGAFSSMGYVPMDVTWQKTFMTVTKG